MVNRIVKKKLDAYRGRLDPAKIANGMNAARTNATRLIQDAELLLEHSRWPAAAALAILAIEEAGKITILRRMSTAKADSEVADVWREYRSHTSKNLAWIVPQLAVAGARTLDQFAPAFDANSDHPYVLDQLKQIAFYTDCLGAAHWSEPQELIDENLARTLVRIARVLSASERRFSEKEIQLWIEYMGPVEKTDGSGMKSALIAWGRAMKAAGLSDEADQLEALVRGQPVGVKPKVPPV